MRAPMTPITITTNHISAFRNRALASSLAAISSGVNGRGGTRGAALPPLLPCALSFESQMGIVKIQPPDELSLDSTVRDFEVDLLEPPE